MKKLSIIIPVYNVEKYVAKCIQSCLIQDLSPHEYEIIIINDGSTDKSLEIIKSIIKNHINVLVFSQNNGGLSVARNIGLYFAKGEYVWFIDADDWIQDNCLGNIVKNLYNIEVLAMGYVLIFEDKVKNKKVQISNSEVTKGIDLLLSSFIMPAQFYIYKRKFLEGNNLSFQSGLLHEDLEFTPRMLYFARKLLVYNELIYFFYKRPGSISTSTNSQKSFDLIRIASKLILFEKEFVDKKYKFIFYNLIGLALNNSFYNSFLMGRKIKKDLEEVLYLNKYMFNYLKSSTIIKYRIEGYLFSFFPKHSLRIYRFMKLFDCTFQNVYFQLLLILF